MFQSKKPESSRGVGHARKFRLRTDAPRDTWCSRALKLQLPRVIGERANNLTFCNRRAEFWRELMNFFCGHAKPRPLRINHNLPMVKMSVEGAKAATRYVNKPNTYASCRIDTLLKHLDNNLVPISIPVKMIKSIS